MRYRDPQLVDRLAAAYVLGTLAGRARRRFERLLHDRGDVALAVRGWEDRLGRLAGPVPPVQPPARVWAGIAAQTRPAPVRSPSRRFAWGWGAGGVLTGALAATAFFMASPALFVTADQVAMRSGGKLPQSYVGLLTDAQGNGKLLVSSLRHGTVLTTKVIGPIEASPAGQRLVLWAIPSAGAPFVLGDVPLQGSATTRLPDTSEKLLAKVTRLGVSAERDAAPQRPSQLLYSGNCAKLW